MAKSKTVYALSGKCCFEGCKELSTEAVKVTVDMWWETCEEHRMKPITLNANTLAKMGRRMPRPEKA